MVRLAQVLLVCAGLVAMHQMGGAGHQMGGAGHQMGGAGHQMGGAGHQMGQPPLTRSLAYGITAAAHDMDALRATLPGAMTGSEATCVAVLLTVLVLTTRRRAAAAAPRPTVVVAGTRPGGPPLGRGPPRLLLARLCVLRT